MNYHLSVIILIQILYLVEGDLRHKNKHLPEKASIFFKHGDTPIKFVTKDINHSRQKRRVLSRNRRFIEFNILYGTKWCGKGNIAKHDNDFGYWSNLDRCCARHDQCPLKIHTNKQRWGVKNTLGYTAMDCQCDDRFYVCLKQISGWESYPAWSVGQIFFNVLTAPCIDIPHGTNLTEQEITIQNVTSVQRNYIFVKKLKKKIKMAYVESQVKFRPAKEFK